MPAPTLPLPQASLWDPRATSSGSIDPMGALRVYTSIATVLFPGVTTVTTRVRYLSWLCSGLRVLDELPGAPTGARAAVKRRGQLLAWERILALATGYHAKKTRLPEGAPAWAGLRGVSYVRSAVDRGDRSPHFNMLLNQAGVGGVGTYWVALVAGGLVDDATGALTSAGTQLADEFLKRAPERPVLRRVLSGDDPTFSAEVLAEWGAERNLDASTATKRERRYLADSLLEPEAQRAMAAAMGAGESAISNADVFGEIAAALDAQRAPLATRLAAVLRLATAFEAFHATLLGQFSILRTADHRGLPTPIPTAAGDTPALATDHTALGESLTAEGPNLPPAVRRVLGDFFQDTLPLANAKTPVDRAAAIVRHHEGVQGGKFDASRQPKRPWVELQGSKILVSPRFALDAPIEVVPGVFTHPYRIEQFAGMMGEADGWTAAS